MRLSVTAMIAMAVLVGCGGSHSTVNYPSPSSTKPTRTRPTPTPSQTQVAVLPSRTASPGYLGFLGSLCHALASHDAATVQGELMNYQYNTGVRYGNLGDGEGQSADPSILNSWLGKAVVRCRFYTPDVAGHGTLLTSGWQLSGGWSLIEMDELNGAWKINDFTFGTAAALHHAMQTSHPILSYRA